MSDIDAATKRAMMITPQATTSTTSSMASAVDDSELMMMSASGGASRENSLDGGCSINVSGNGTGVSGVGGIGISGVEVITTTCHPLPISENLIPEEIDPIEEEEDDDIIDEDDDDIDILDEYNLCGIKTGKCVGSGSGKCTEGVQSETDGKKPEISAPTSSSATVATGKKLKSFPSSSKNVDKKTKTALNITNTLKTGATLIENVNKNKQQKSNSTTSSKHSAKSKGDEKGRLNKAAAAGKFSGKKVAADTKGEKSTIEKEGADDADGASTAENEGAAGTSSGGSGGKSSKLGYNNIIASLLRTTTL